MKIADSHKALLEGSKHRRVVSIEEYLKPISPSLMDNSPNSFDSYYDNGQTFSVLHINDKGDRYEGLHLSKSLVFSVDAHRQFSEPIKLSVLQKGYIRIIFVLAGEVDITGPDGKTHSLFSRYGFISRYGYTPVLYNTSKPQTFSAVSVIASPQALQMLIGLSADKLPAALQNILNKKNGDNFSSVFNLDQNVLPLVVDIIKPSNDPISLRQLYLKSKLLALMYAVVKQFKHQEQPKRSLTVSYQPAAIQRLNKVRELIESRISNPPSIHELCELASCNRVKLIAQFKQNFGLTPYQYGLEQRFQYARRLLEEEEYSIAEVADQIGYKELSSFSRGFRLRFGKPPSEISKNS